MTLKQRPEEHFDMLFGFVYIFPQDIYSIVPYAIDFLPIESFS